MLVFERGEHLEAQEFVEALRARRQCAEVGVVEGPGPRRVEQGAVGLVQGDVHRVGFFAVRELLAQEEDAVAGVSELEGVPGPVAANVRPAW